MHRGILLSFYSSAAAFVNGKRACFLLGFLGRAQKKPRRAVALRGKKCVIILYLFALVVGVLDLERNCHVALLGVALNNNTNVRPIAILADVNIRTGIDPL